MTTSETTELPELVIHSEDEAFALLKLALEGNLPPWASVRFDGWPKLEIYLKGKDFDSSLTPPVMKGLLEFQKGIYHSYAVAKYEDASRRLTDEEKKALEIVVKVESGSSDLSVDFQELAVKFIEQIGGKMDSTHVLILGLTFLVLHFGKAALTSYLDNRKEVRLREVSDETQRKTLEMLTFQSEKETERLVIVTQALAQKPQAQEMAAIANDSKTELLRGLVEAEQARVSGVSFSGPAAMSLVQNARRESEEIRLDGTYRLFKLDWTDQSKLRVKVWNTQTGQELDAILENDTLSGAYKDLLRKAEWDRTPVQLKINARRVGGTLRGATILEVSAAPHPPPAEAKAI